MSHFQPTRARTRLAAVALGASVLTTPAWAQTTVPLHGLAWIVHQRFWALGVLVFVAGVVLALNCLRQFREGMQPVDRVGTSKSPARWFEVLLIDPKTATYSLSSFQFAAWSFAFLLAYIYLFVGHVLVQGATDFVDLPAEFATMLAATAGTAVVSTGIDTARGSKGSGAIHPSLSDLVSNGGVFAPERFQFLVWTLVGISGYLIVTFSQPLDTIDSLPKVGSGILGLSGVSGLAYLGGKLTRTAGPVIANLGKQPGTETTSGDPLIRRIFGQQLPLDPTGSYVLKDKDGTETRCIPGPAGGGKVKAITPADATSGFATVVDITLPTPFALPGTVTITNPDQQTAVAAIPE